MLANYNKIKNETLDYVVNNYLYTLLIQEQQNLILEY